MTQKRPFNDEVVDEISSKHQRQDGPGSEIISCNGIPPNPSESGEASLEKNKPVFHGHETSNCPDTIKESENDAESDVPRSTSSIFHWATRCPTVEDNPSEEFIHLPFFPGYFSFDRPARPTITPDDVYYCLLDYPPRKRVPIGPEHQAEIPGSLGSDNSEPEALDDSEVEGICILPNPKTDPPCIEMKVGDGRTECICLDKGSVRCVRQHVIEARDKLRDTLGQDTFMELGFYDMGEVVAEKWSEEEEQLFHEVVYSNPASLGKNFWNALSVVFPSRTKMEIVSYYFNVFMLRKRAEQNRCDPMNVDSDNDEWQGGSDDDGADDGDVSEEEDDSGVESPVVQNGLEFHNQVGLGVNEDEDEGVDGDVSTDEANENHGGSHKSECCDNDVQNGSCTSSDSGVKAEGCQEWHEYIGKGWDEYGGMSCLKSNEELLPTCSMIEEVFGNGDIESNTNRW